MAGAEDFRDGSPGAVASCRGQARVRHSEALRAFAGASWQAHRGFDGDCHGRTLRVERVALAALGGTAMTQAASGWISIALAGRGAPGGAAAGRQHRRPSTSRPETAAPRRLRLHRRRRRGGNHASRELRAPSSDVTLPAARRGRHPRVRSAHDGARRRRSTLPFLLAPVGSSRMFYPRGEELAAARPPANAGTAYILSTLSGTRLEDVRAASQGPDVVPGLSLRWPGVASRDDRAGRRGRVHRARRHHRHAGVGHARARRPERRQGARGGGVVDAPVSSADVRRARAGSRECCLTAV